ncbi:MAG TPA: exonuclease domain-containing protein [Nocardioides sp.]|nr:exonuclease domain-containing protein [Nocardioides sp.]
MTHWRDGVLWSWDTETTGTNVETDRIVTSTILRIENGQVEQHEWLIDPGVEIPEGAAKIHGITTEKAREQGRPAAEALAEIFELLVKAWQADEPVIIYNAPYDCTLTDREVQRHLGERLTPYIGQTVDPLVCDKHIDPFRKGSRKLIDTARHYGVVLSEEDAHSSAGDTLAAARLAYMIAGPTAGVVLRGGEDRRGLIHRMSLEELTQAQVGWAEAQQRSFAEYKGRSDATLRERLLSEIGWPYRPDRPAPVTQDPIPF